MKIHKINSEVKEVYDKFSKKPFSEHIATPVSMEALFRILKRENPQRTLEIGGGVGTLSYLILNNSRAQLDVFEDLDFCIKELRKNLVNFTGRYNLITSYEGFKAPHSSYDLVVVDGGTEDFLARMANNLERIGVIYIDGNREGQRRVLRKNLRERYVFKVKKYVDVSKNFKGGFEISCCRTSNVLLRFISYWRWEMFYYFSIKTRNLLRRFLDNEEFLSDYKK